MPSMVIEIARTVNGVTEPLSHLRHAGVPLTLCSLTARLRGEAREWYPVGQDEAQTFAPCPTCEARAGLYRLVSRPPFSERPRLVGAARTTERAGGTIGYAVLAGAVCQTLFDQMDGRTLVPDTILVDLYRTAQSMTDLTIGDGLTDASISAAEAVSRFNSIRSYAARIRYGLAPYVDGSQVPENAEAARDTPEAPNGPPEPATGLSEACDD